MMVLEPELRQVTSHHDSVQQPDCRGAPYFAHVVSSWPDSSSVGSRFESWWVHEK
jgi:hypothetical protein